MYMLKGFIQINALVNNATGVNALFGEQSTWTLTYTREKGEYISAAAAGYVLTAAASYRDDTGKLPVTQPIADSVLAVAKWINDYGLSKSTFIVRADFHDDILAQFNSTMGTLNFGSFVSNGTYSVPEWISWTDASIVGANILKIWFSDTAFGQQYDGFEIVVIPPVDDLDDFFLSANVVQTKVNAKTLSEQIDAIQEAKQKHPETVIRTEVYNWVNVNYPGITFGTPWSLLIYGIAGDNVDSIKDAIIDYILENSTHTREEWTAILPDLFKRTEFLILPRWDKFAIPNLTVQEGIYSPIMNPTECIAFAKTKVTAFPAAWIDLHLTIHPSTYRSVALLSISNPTNTNDNFELTDVFSDFINVGTGSTDFNRMEDDTRTWSLLMETLVITAEGMTAFSDLPTGMRRLTRDGLVCVAKVLNNIQYIVAAKINYF